MNSSGSHFFYLHSCAALKENIKQQDSQQASKVPLDGNDSKTTALMSKLHSTSGLCEKHWRSIATVICIISRRTSCCWLLQVSLCNTKANLVHCANKS
jgi:hypothetical protein